MTTDRRNSFWLAFQFIFGIFSAIITLKINISHYGKSEFGVWILLAAIWGLGSAMDFGFGTSTIKYVAEYNKYEKGKINNLLSTTIFVFLTVGLLILVAGNVLAEILYFKNTSIISAENLHKFKIVFIFLSTAFYLRYLTLFFKAIFQGFNNFVFTSKVTFVYNVILFICVLISSLLNLSIIYLAAFYIADALVILILYFYKFRKNYSQYKIAVKYFDFNTVKQCFSFSFSIQLSTIFNALMDPTIKYLIGNYLEVSFVSTYEIARRFVMALTNLFFTTFMTILPKASLIRTAGDKQTFILNECSKLSKIGVSYSGLVFGIFAIIITTFARMWFNIDEVVIIFLILSLPETINNFGYSLYNYILGTGRAMFLAAIQLNNLIITTVLLFVGLKYFHNIFGLLGYFISVLTGNILMLWFVKKDGKIRMLKYLKLTKFNKVLSLDLMILSSLIIIVYNISNFYVPLIIISFVSILIFGNDIISLTRNVISEIRIKFAINQN